MEGVFEYQYYYLVSKKIMWNPFKKKPLLSEKNETFQIETFKWLLRNFDGKKFFKKTQLVLPTETFFPVKSQEPEKVVQKIFQLVKKYAGLSEWPCILKAQEDDPNFRVSEVLTLKNMEHNPLGTFSVNENDEILITYNPKIVTTPTQMVATLSHELSHYLTSTSLEPPPGGWENWEFATDITATFLGFGIFQANSAFSFKQFNEAGVQGWEASRGGYLSEAEHSYALAIFLKLKKIPPDEVYPYCGTNIKAYLKKALKELDENTHIDTLLKVKYDSFLKLPKQLKKRLNTPVAIKGKLYSLELLNDDITPSSYVLEVLTECLNIDEYQATDIMMEAENTGVSEVLNGSRTLLLDIANFIEKDAKDRKYPLKLRIAMKS